MVSRTVVLLLSLASLGAVRPGDWPAAAKKGDTDRVQALLKAGAELEAKDRDGRTALMLAAQYGRTDTVRLLLARGANAGARDRRGWNAYMLALLSPSGGIIHTVHDNVLKLLPPPHFRLAVETRWARGTSFFSSCFMRAEDLARHMNGVRPEFLVLEAFRDYAFSSGRGLVELVQTPAGADGVLERAAAEVPLGDRGAAQEAQGPAGQAGPAARPAQEKRFAPLAEGLGGGQVV